ncbi:hypothetical protein SAMN05444354_105367 [Stigmatella aurantiaca]|uniref:Uncharacterized protein n=2 Tax=Stigmatella aurantiaca TaxID=41 RepID=A0A1H7PR73_STIAU|nr:hypothetical protein SAMN05444354_105367 [Stigmatella aurantiaca]
MEPKQFLDSIYLGDRGCKCVLIEGYIERLIMVVDLISRILSESGEWDFYQDENIADGRIVFSRVKSVEFSPPGFIPNGFIDDIEVEGSELGPDGKPLYLFVASISGTRNASTVTTAGNTTERAEVILRIKAGGVHLEDPRFPGKEIRD